MKNKLFKEVTMAEIDSVWGNSNFGGSTRHDVVRSGLLKCASGYYQGATSTAILRELKLITKKYTLTRRGKAQLWAWFKISNNV